MTLNEIKAWREAAEQDGWEFEPTYQHESRDTHATAKREGWTIMVNARNERNASLGVWAPDGSGVVAPTIYSMDTLEAGRFRCDICEAEGVETHRVGFANRSCRPCLPAARRKWEFPGWTN
jgi:hypothetical protein